MGFSWGNQFAKSGRLGLDKGKPQGQRRAAALRSLFSMLGIRIVGCRPTTRGAGREGGRGVSQCTTPSCLSPQRAIPAMLCCQPLNSGPAWGAFVFMSCVLLTNRVGIVLRSAHDPRTPVRLRSLCIPCKWAKGNGQERAIWREVHELGERSKGIGHSRRSRKGIGYAKTSTECRT